MEWSGGEIQRMNHRMRKYLAVGPFHQDDIPDLDLFWTQRMTSHVSINVNANLVWTISFLCCHYFQPENYFNV